MIKCLFKYTSIFCFSIRRKGSNAVQRNLCRIVVRRIACTVMPFLQIRSVMYVHLFFLQENYCPSVFCLVIFRLYMRSHLLILILQQGCLRGTFVLRMLHLYNNGWIYVVKTLSSYEVPLVFRKISEQ